MPSSGPLSGSSQDSPLIPKFPCSFYPANILPVIIITSLLMVSEIPMFSLKFSGFSFAENWYRYIFPAERPFASSVFEIVRITGGHPFLCDPLLAFYLLRVEL